MFWGPGSICVYSLPVAPCWLMSISVLHTVQNAWWGRLDMWRQGHLPNSCQSLIFPNLFYRGGSATMALQAYSFICSSNGFREMRQLACYLQHTHTTLMNEWLTTLLGKLNILILPFQCCLHRQWQQTAEEGSVIRSAWLAWGTDLNWTHGAFGRRGRWARVLNTLLCAVLLENVGWMVEHTDTSHVSIHFTKMSGPSLIHLTDLFHISWGEHLPSLLGIPFGSPCRFLMLQTSSQPDPSTVWDCGKNCPCKYGIKYQDRMTEQGSWPNHKTANAYVEYLFFQCIPGIWGCSHCSTKPTQKASSPI